MKIRLATIVDLMRIQNLYTKIVLDMNTHSIFLWNEHYPNECFAEDILKKRLYMILEENTILSCFVLCSTNQGENQMNWSHYGKAFYLERLGVNPLLTNKGIGSKTLNLACNIVKEKNGTFLRLFVAKNNIPAINLYEKNHFVYCGEYQEKIEENFSIFEYAYEKVIK